MLNIVSLSLISVLIGFLGSLTGLGGASILIPILVLLGVPVKEAKRQRQCGSIGQPTPSFTQNVPNPLNQFVGLERLGHEFSGA